MQIQSPIEVSVAHAEILNQASKERRDFSLINWTGSVDSPKVESCGRMLYSDDLQFGLDTVGGFWAHHVPSGIVAYAYPSSIHADSAKRRETLQIGIARDMIQDVWNSLPFYSAQPWWTESMRERLARFQSAMAQRGGCIPTPSPREARQA